MAKNSGMLSGLSRKNPPQMKSGDPKPASSYPSVDSGAMRDSAASTPKSIGGRNA